MSTKGLNGEPSLAEVLASTIKRVGEEREAETPATQAIARQELGPPALGAPRPTVDSAAMLFTPAAAAANPNKMLSTLWRSRARIGTRSSSLPVVPREPVPAPAPDSFHDSSANLLRPLLRQWLDANMTHVVARALQIEALGGDGKETNTEDH